MVRSATSSEEPHPHGDPGACAACGSALQAGARFCTECGQPVVEASTGAAVPESEVRGAGFEAPGAAPTTVDPATVDPAAVDPTIVDQATAAEPEAEAPAAGPGGAAAVAPERGGPTAGSNPWVPDGALEPNDLDPTSVQRPVGVAGGHQRGEHVSRQETHREGAHGERTYRRHPIGGVLAVLAGAAVIAGTFLGLFTVSVNGVRSPTVTVWRAGTTMKVPAVVVEHTDDGRRASISDTRTASARLQAPGASLFSLDPTPGQDRWILLAAGVIAVVVGSTAILRSRLIWRLVLLLDGALVGVVTARYLVGVTRNVVPGYRGPPDVSLRLSFSTQVGLGMVLLFAASGVLVVAAVCSAVSRRPGSLRGERSATTS